MAHWTMTCPYCEAEIPLDSSTSSGEEVYCSYCNCPVIAQRLDRELWNGVPSEDWEAIKKKQRKAEDKMREEAAASGASDDGPSHGGRKGGGH